MARPSRWMQFAQNFNAMKGTLDDAFKQYDINKVGKQDYFAEDGTTKLEGDALSRAKTDALAGVYEKWGDAEGALNLRAKGAELEGLMRTNRIGAATEQDQIYIQGAGARANLDSGIAANRASAASSNASAALSNLQAQSITDQRAFDNTVRGIMTEAGKMEFDTPEAENEWVTAQIRAADIPMSIKTNALTALKEFGSANIALESAAITRAANDAIGGGLTTFKDWYNGEIADGYQLEVSDPDENGKITAYAVTGEGDNVRRSVIATGQGEGADMQILNALYTQVTSPGNILGAAVDNLAYRRSQTDQQAAERGLLKTDAEIAQINSNINLTDERARQVVAEVAGQELQNDNYMTRFNADIDNIRSQIAARGVSSKLDESQMALVAAQTAKITTELERSDPERQMTSAERTKFLAEQWTVVARQMLAFDSGTTAEQLKAAQEAFYATMGAAGQNFAGFSMTPVQ